MGIDTTRLKLLAFAMGATFGGVAGGMFSAIQGFVSPESFVLVESIMVVSMVVLGGMGNVWGVILGALLLSFVPEFLRFTVEPVQQAALRQHAHRAGSDPHADLRLRAGARHAALRPGGLLPSAVRKRELAARDGSPAERAVSALLEATDVSKRFGGIEALAECQLLASRAARSSGSIGPNGAGQDDAVQPAHRHLSRPIAARSRSTAASLAGSKPDRVAARGHRAHLPEHPPVRQPVRAGERHDRPARAHARGRARRGAARPGDARRGGGDRARAPRSCSTTSASAPAANEAAGSLPYGDQRRLEIARALATDPALLALDEPAAGMNASETAGAARAARAHPRRRHDAAAHRARHAPGDERLRPRAGARLRRAASPRARRPRCSAIRR